MKLFTNVLLLSFFVPFLAVAQSNYKPGYVVNLKGDTLRGFIDYREWSKNPAQFSFKSGTAEMPERVYTTQDAKAFAVNGSEYYECHVVHISLDPIELSGLEHMVDTSYRADTVFLRVLTKGRYLSLYTYNDNIKNRFYELEPGDSQPQELAYHVYISTDESSSIKYVNRYRYQLQYIAQKNNVSDNKLATTLAQSHYEEADMLSIANIINGGGTKQFVSKSQFGSRLFAGLGVSNNNLQFTGYYSTPNGSSISPKLSAGIDLFANKNVQQLFLRAELDVTMDTHTFSDLSISGDDYGPNSLHFNQYTVALAPQVVFNIYNTDMLKVFISGGISFNFSTYPNSYFTQVFFDNSTVKSSTIITYHSVWESYPLKAGLFLNKKLEIYACYVLSAQLTDNFYSFDGSVKSYQAGINYLFGVK